MRYAVVALLLAFVVGMYFVVDRGFYCVPMVYADRTLPTCGFWE